MLLGKPFGGGLKPIRESPALIVAEFSFVTNAAPSGGHLESDRSSVTAAVDTILLHSVGWTDDVDDLPLTHAFGYMQGYQEVIASARCARLYERILVVFCFLGVFKCCRNKRTFFELHSIWSAFVKSFVHQAD